MFGRGPTHHILRYVNMSKRPYEEEEEEPLVLLEEEPLVLLKKVPELTEELWQRIVAHSRSARELWRYAIFNRLSRRIAGRVFAAMFDRDVGAHASLTAPLNSIFHFLATAATGHPNADASEAVWDFHVRSVLVPNYQAAAREVAEGMYAALRGLAQRAAADARAHADEAQAQQELEDATQTEYVALLRWSPEDAAVGQFTLTRSWDGGLMLAFARVIESGLDAPEEMAIGRLEAYLAENTNGRLLAEGEEALRYLLVDLFMMLLLGHSPRLSLHVGEEYVSMETWGTIKDADADVLTDTFLGDFARLLHARPMCPFNIHANEGPYNFIDLHIQGTCGIQVRQTALDYEEEGAYRIDLGTRSGKGLPASVIALRALGWSDTTKLQGKLGIGLMMTASRTRQVALFLEQTLRLLASILDEAAAAQQTVVLISCQAGLERSLVLFNVFAYAVGVVGLFRSGWTGPASQIAAAVGLRLSTSRPDEDAVQRTILNELILTAVNNIPHLFEILLSVHYNK